MVAAKVIIRIVYTPLWQAYNAIGRLLPFTGRRQQFMYESILGDLMQLNCSSYMSGAVSVRNVDLDRFWKNPGFVSSLLKISLNYDICDYFSYEWNMLNLNKTLWFIQKIKDCSKQCLLKMFEFDCSWL